MRKLVLVLLSLSIFSCTDNSDDFCNPECWTVINKKTREVSPNVYTFSIKVRRNCVDNAEWVRIYLENTNQLSSYEVGDVICDESIKNN